MKPFIASVMRVVAAIATLGLLPLVTRPLRLAKLDHVTPENVRTNTKDILAALDSVGAGMMAPNLVRIAQVMALALQEDTKAIDKALRNTRLVLSALTKGTEGGVKPKEKKEDE